MAIIDLGKVSITWRGAYDGSTAYTPKDAVSYQNASYICTANTTGNLPTDTTYWNVMAAKGVDGTDVGTTLTTQGDILYRDGSGLQRLAAGTAGQALLTGGAGANVSWGTIDSGKIKKTHWQWDNQQADIPTTHNGSGTGLDIFNYNFTNVSANPHFVLDLSVFVGRDDTGNDSGDVYVAAWIHDQSDATQIKYPFGFYKGSGFRCNANFRALTGNYFLEETDAGQYGNSNDWSGMRWSWPGVMGNQQNPDTNPTAATISAGSSLTLSIHIGGSGNTYYNKTKNQSNSTSRSWFRLTELDGTL